MTDTKQLAKLQRTLADATGAIWPDGPTTGAATGVDMVNTTNTMKWVRITGGTITSIKIGPPGNTVVITTMATADGLIPVGPGKALNIVHTGAPTLQWLEG